MTVFHKIINREIPASIVYEDDDVIAINDIQPVAPIHVLVIPKQDLISLQYADDTYTMMLGKVMVGCKKVAEILDIVDKGFRVVINSGEQVGQSVFQLHAHVLSGREFKWPPG